MIANREIPGTSTRANKAMINQFELLRSKLGELTPADKRRLGIEGGVKVKANLSGKFAQRTHMCTGFVIYAINDTPINTLQDFEKAISDQNGVMLSGVYPDGCRDRYYLELV